MMDGFTESFPEGGPSVSQNTRTGTLTITFSLGAGDARDAVTEAIDIFAAGVAAAELAPTDVLDIEVSAEAADDTQTDEHPVLQPA
jgi:hypothetical protein